MRVREAELAGAFETHRLSAALEKNFDKVAGPGVDSVVPGHDVAKQLFDAQDEYSNLAELMNRMKTVASERFQAHLHIANVTLDRYENVEGEASSSTESLADRVRSPSAELALMLFFDGRRGVKFLGSQPEGNTNSTLAPAKPGTLVYWTAGLENVRQIVKNEKPLQPALLPGNLAPEASTEFQKWLRKRKYTRAEIEQYLYDELRKIDFDGFKYSYVMTVHLTCDPRFRHRQLGSPLPVVGKRGTVEPKKFLEEFDARMCGVFVLILAWMIRF